MGYRKLNDVTKKNCFSLPWIENTLDMLAVAKWFSTLDLKSGYWQVDMHWRQGEDCVLDRSRVMSVHGDALWPLQSSSDI
jgi:hypothetical protein